MNQIKVFFKRLSILTAGITILFFITLPLSADDVYISLSTEGCEVMAEAEDNQCDAGQCAGDAACVCAQKGQFLVWDLPSGEKFKMIFTGNDPLRDNCGKNYKAGHKCKIKEEVEEGDSYSYLIKLQRCDDGSDPRIIIRK